MLKLGLTGSMGMGKSATAAMLRRCGVPTHDSDAATHRLYCGLARAPIEAAFPGVVREGVVDRARLGARVLGDDRAMARLEAIVHPLVAADRDAFCAGAQAKGARIVALDIPLLFEVGGEGLVDAILVVSAPLSVQKARVLARPGMTAEKFAAIVARQVPDAEKRRGAHFVIDTGAGFEAAARAVRAMLRALAGVAK